MQKLLFGFGLVLILNFTSGQNSEDAPSFERMLEGQLAKPKELKYVAAVFYDEGPARPCLATIMSPRWVLSNAFCLSLFKGEKGNIDYPFDVVAGVTDWGDPEIDKVQQKVKVEDILYHPQMDRDNLKVVEADIALLKVEPRLVFNEFVQSVDFYENTGNNLYYGKRCIISSYDWDKYTDVIKDRPKWKKKLRSYLYINNTDCENYMNRPVDAGTMCVIEEWGVNNLCNGDLGAGVVCYGGLIGLVHHIENPCERKKNSVIQINDIRHFIPWIDTVIGKKRRAQSRMLDSGSQGLNFSFLTFILNSSVVVILLFIF